MRKPVIIGGVLAGLAVLTGIVVFSQKKALASQVDPRVIRLQQLLAKRGSGTPLGIPELIEAMNLAVAFNMGQTAGILNNELIMATNALTPPAVPAPLPKNEPWPTPSLPGVQSPTQNVFDAVASYIKAKLPTG